MHQPERIFLIGGRGAGKTTVGRELARLLGWEWVDSDAAIEAATGRSVAQVFAESGEPEFRRIEAQQVALLCQRENCVVSLGGGAVLDPASRGSLAAAGPVVWLQAPAAVLAQRIAADAAGGAARPSLTGKSPEEEIAQVLAAREAIYRGCADLTLDAAELPPATIANQIARQLGLSAPTS